MQRKPFQPPPNDQSRINHLNDASLTDKTIWGTSEISRALVTYKLTAKVYKSTAYITTKGNKLIVPNVLTFSRTHPIESTNQKSHKSHIDQEHRDLEDYFDATLGVIVFNRVSLPANKCERYRSISDIPDASLFKSKIADFSILRYLRENQSVAITLDTMYKETCIKQVSQI